MLGANIEKDEDSFNGAGSSDISGLNDFRRDIH